MPIILHVRPEAVFALHVPIKIVPLEAHVPIHHVIAVIPSLPEAILPEIVVIHPQREAVVVPVRLEVREVVDVPVAVEAGVVNTISKKYIL